METFPIFITEDEKLIATVRRLVEIDLPSDLTDKEINWLQGSKIKDGQIIYNVVGRGLNSGEYRLYIPDCEEDFITEYGDAPDRLRKILRALFIYYNKANIKDRGFVILYPYQLNLENRRKNEIIRNSVK